MREIKSFELLKGITEDELSALGDFVKSKIFNTNKNVVSLYNFLKKNYHRVNKGTISREEIYRQTFKSKNFNESQYWKLTSAFSLVLDRFLIYTEFEKDIFYKKNLLLENYRKRNLRSQFSIMSREFFKDSQKEFNKSINFFVNQSHFYFQKISYMSYDTTETFSRDTEKLFENLRMFFIMTHIVSISIISSFDKNFINYCKTNLWMFNQILIYLDKNKSYIKKNYITVYTFYLILYSKIYPERENYYAELKKIVLKSTSFFSGNFLRHVLVNMLDYAVGKLASGEEKYLKEIFIINKIMAEKSLTFFGENIREEYFFSVVEHAVELQEVNWTREFIDKYKIYLRADRRDTVVNLSLSKIHFAQKEFDESLKYLLKVSNINPYFYIAHKILLLQNYYEKNDFKAVKHVLESLNKYLKRRNDIQTDMAENCQKFLVYYKRLLKLRKEPGEQLEVSKLKKEKYFLNKPWLLRKMEFSV